MRPLYLLAHFALRSARTDQGKTTPVKGRKGKKGKKGKAPPANYCPTNEHLTPGDIVTLTIFLDKIIQKHDNNDYRGSADLLIKDLRDCPLLKTTRGVGCPTLMLDILNGKVPRNDDQIRLVLGMCPRKLRSGQTADLSTSLAFTGACINAMYK